MTQKAYERGLLTITAGTYGNVLRTLMPLVITDDELGEGLDVLEAALADVQRRARVRSPPPRCALAACVALRGRRRPAAAEKADRIFINGRIWTGDSREAAGRGARRPRADARGRGHHRRDPEAQGEDDGRGRPEGPLRLPRVRRRSPSLHGRKPVPGHGQPRGRLERRGDPEADHAPSPRPIPTRAWVVGRGWFYGAFPGGMPHKKYLDAIVSDRPVWMTGYDGHTGWANSVALTKAGITKLSPDPHERRHREGRERASPRAC